jgi:hypothetical protein
VQTLLYWYGCQFGTLDGKSSGAWIPKLYAVSSVRLTKKLQEKGQCRTKWSYLFCSALISTPFNALPYMIATMAVVIPTTQTAAVLRNPGMSAELVIRHDESVASPGSHEILVKLQCTGIWYVNSKLVLFWMIVLICYPSL